MPCCNRRSDDGAIASDENDTIAAAFEVHESEHLVLTPGLRPTETQRRGDSVGAKGGAAIDGEGLHGGRLPTVLSVPPGTLRPCLDVRPPKNALEPLLIASRNASRVQRLNSASSISTHRSNSSSPRCYPRSALTSGSMPPRLRCSRRTRRQKRSRGLTERRSST